MGRSRRCCRRRRLSPWRSTITAEPARLHRADLPDPRRDEYLLTLPGTGRILVRNGNEITVEPEASPASSNLCAILSGPIQAVLWHQRELLPLHASVVVIRGRAIALCGESLLASRRWPRCWLRKVTT